MLRWEAAILHLAPDVRFGTSVQGQKRSKRDSTPLHQMEVGLKNLLMSSVAEREKGSIRTTLTAAVVNDAGHVCLVQSRWQYGEV